MREGKFKRGRLFLIVLLIALQGFSQLTPSEALEGMQRGINLGNTLEAQYEGWWAAEAEEYYFDMYKEAGFTCVRVPVRWDYHTDEESPYTIDADWLDRVEEILDWSLERGMFTIVNAHHEEWIKEDYSDDNKARFDSIWAQVSRRFKDKSDSLLFEMFNEPYPMELSDVNDCNARILSIIRETNPTRIVLFSGHKWCNVSELVQATIPDDDYLMGYFHSYDPYDFGLNGNGSWGSDSDREDVADNYLNAQKWSEKNDIPVVIGEFGAVEQCDYNSRMKHYKTYAEEAIKHNVAFNVWDDSGDFEVLQREEKIWNDMKDIVMYTTTESPDYLNLMCSEDMEITLYWQNRTTENDSIIVQKRVGQDYGNFDTIAILAPDADEYTDADVLEGEDYYYRVIAYFNDTTDMYGYPQHINAVYTSEDEIVADDIIQCIYPNPAEGEIYIYADIEYIDNIVLTTADGKEILRLTNPENTVIDVSKYPRGLYILTVLSGDEHYSKEIMLK